MYLILEMNQLFPLRNGMIIMSDEKQKSEMSGTRMDTQLTFHDGASAKKSSERKKSEVDVEPMEEDKSGANISINGNTSEEDMVKSNKNDSIESAIEVKKKNKSTSTRDF
ncbi:hypothetical protein MKX01_008990 [Papaver californicum]|nr:hypothetical protein MKX01_008990 [Papaver californicum]